MEKGLGKKGSKIAIKMLSLNEPQKISRETKTPSRQQLRTSDKSSPRDCRITCKNLIRQHEESVTGEQLIKQKGTFQVSFVNEMARLDGKLTEIHDSLESGEKFFLVIM